jgi:hypothetical protein
MAEIIFLLLMTYIELTELNEILKIEKYFQCIDSYLQCFVSLDCHTGSNITA